MKFTAKAFISALPALMVITQGNESFIRIVTTMRLKMEAVPTH